MELRSPHHKLSGAYYTPPAVVSCLIRWAVRQPDDRMLDPSCGDGRFLAGHRHSVGIEQNHDEAARAGQRAPWALIHEGDFFSWASETSERFACAAGNPPFIRYQSFKGDTRKRALDMCHAAGAQFSALTSSWAPFLVATASLLRAGGRMAFVVPAEIGHAPYAAPLLEYLVTHFTTVHVVAIRDKLFDDLSEDCWLLFADGYGGRTSEIRFTALDRFNPKANLLRSFNRVAVDEWRSIWNRRLRPFLLPAAVRDLYRSVAEDRRSSRFGSIANVGIGYVSGANSFFHLRPSEAEALGIPKQFLHATVRNGRALAGGRLTPAVVADWQRKDEPVMLLKLPRAKQLPRSVLNYLDSAAGEEARKAYKCRVRDPWYSVPDVKVPDFFMSYMSGVSASLVQNQAGATCTNSVHAVRVLDRSAVGNLKAQWDSPFLQLSREIEGHPLGGGMLKLEPREASQLVVPSGAVSVKLGGADILSAVATMREWRHYAVH